MNVISRTVANLFRERRTVEAITERTESDLAARLAQVEAEISGGSGDILSLLEEKESLKRAVHAAHIARSNASDAAYRERVTTAANELRGRLDNSLYELGDLVPRLLLACAGFNAIAREVQEKGLGFSQPHQMLDELIGLPADFGEKVTAAIREAAPATEWDYSHTGPSHHGKRADKPVLCGPKTYIIKTQIGGPPPGYTGAWDPRVGPVDLP